MKKATLKIFSVLVVAAFLFAANAHAQIVYTDVIPDTTVSATNGAYNLDLNNDGVIDFTLRKENVYFCPAMLGAISTTYTDIVIDALNGNEVSNDTNNYPKKLKFNNVIKNGGTAWIDAADQLLAKKSNVIRRGRDHCFIASPLTYAGNWNAAGNRYVGLRLIVGATKYYGWVRLNVANGGNAVTIKDYAYDSTPGHSIKAGATSGARLINDAVTNETLTEDQIIIAPNPFSNTTTITFSISKSQKVSVQIFDITGRLIKTFSDKEMSQGNQQIDWNATDNKGQAVGAGIYFLNLYDGEKSYSRKLIVQ